MSSYELANDATPPAAAHAPRPAKRPLSTRWISLLTLITLIAAWWAVTAAGLIEPLFGGARLLSQTLLTVTCLGGACAFVLRRRSRIAAARAKARAAAEAQSLDEDF